MSTVKYDEMLQEIELEAAIYESVADPDHPMLLNVKTLLSTVRELQRQNDELTNVVGMCRAAAGWGTDADPMNVQSWAAMGDPAEVPDFIRDQFRDLQRQVQERDHLLEDAHQELLGNECGSPELHDAIQDILIENEDKPHG